LRAAQELDNQDRSKTTKTRASGVTIKGKGKKVDRFDADGIKIDGRAGPKSEAIVLGKCKFLSPVSAEQHLMD
jgi:hypothetical protein